MSLNWNLVNVKDHDTLCWVKIKDPETGKEEDRMHQTTDSLIWATMFVGIGEITEENWMEFFARLSILEKLTGTLRQARHSDGRVESVYFTADEVRSHIGLTTNVFPKETLAKWSKRQIGTRIDEIIRELKQAHKKAA